MPFKIYDTKDAVPKEQQEKALALADGKFAVEEAGKTDEDVANLTKSLEKEREQRQAEERARKKAEDDLAAEKRSREAKGAGVTEEQLQKLREEDAKARKPLEDKIAELETALGSTRGENRKLKLTDKVQALFLAAGGMPDRVQKAMKDLSDRVDLTQDGDSIVVKDATGKVTTEKVEDFLAKTYKAEAPYYYQGTGAAGSGAEGGGGGGDPAPSRSNEHAAAVRGTF